MGSDLLLLAIRYVAGEMPGDETADFEDRLANDQEAREAVAHAVELAGAVAQLPPGAPHIVPLRRPRLRRFAGLAAAACMLVAAGMLLRPQTPAPSVSPPVPPVVATPDHAGTVALAWSGLRQSGEIDLVSHSELLAWLDDPAGSPALDVLVPGTREAEEDGLPAWLLEATSLRERSSASAGPGEN